MYVVGLTGGIASGKSAVSNILRKLGACIIDADQLAREIVEPGQPAWQEIVDYFGKDIVLANGHLNRKRLGTIVFNSPSDRDVLNRITHDKILSKMREAIRDIGKTGRKIVVLDVPLLIEAGFSDLVNEVWVVYVNEPLQLKRLQKRDQLTVEEAKARIQSQMPLRDKLRYTTIIINNEGDLTATACQVETEWKRVCELVKIEE
ncbi:MAG: dephospho-CoA kinase [Firmicutes bacterium]|nr:dephospho-CoA kinase [Bacillota bacterium]